MISFRWDIREREINVAQLDEELRVACGRPERPGLESDGVALSTVALLDPALREKCDAVVEAHEPDPHFGESEDERIVRELLEDPDVAAAAEVFTARPSAGGIDIPIAVTGSTDVTGKLARAVLALARMQKEGR